VSSPVVSVVVPTYNRAGYIRRAVDSVLAQTYRDFEVIIVDDGSDDDTQCVVEAYGGRVRYVFQDNAGPGAARNHGTRISTGTYLAFLDSDDVWLPTFLAKTVSALETHPGTDVATTGIYIGPADRKQVALLDGVQAGEWRLPTRCTRRQAPYLFSCCWSGAVVSRREVIERYGGFYEHGCRLGEDVYLWIQVLLNHRLYRIDEPLAWYDTEASGLGFASGCRHYPLEPVLTDPEPIWNNCTPEYREFLATWLASHAVTSIHIQIASGDYENAWWLIEHYPAVRKWRSDWLRIRFKLAFPPVTNLLRGARHALQGRRARGQA
jgi:glycosyltransferase involved in cell wall biosynthesis